MAGSDVVSGTSENVTTTSSGYPSRRTVAGIAGWYAPLSSTDVEPDVNPEASGSTAGTSSVVTSGWSPSATGPEPSEAKSVPSSNRTSPVSRSVSVYPVARTLSRSPVNVSRNRPPSGTASEFSTRTSTEPLPVPAVCVGAVTEAPT